jgi:hypothetical protein
MELYRKVRDEFIRSDAFKGKYPCLNTKVRRLSGGMDQVGYQSDPGYSYSHGSPKPEAFCHTQRTQHVDVACLQRSKERFGELHVSDQHGSHAESGRTRTLPRRLLQENISEAKLINTPCRWDT